MDHVYSKQKYRYRILLRGRGRHRGDGDDDRVHDDVRARDDDRVLHGRGVHDALSLLLLHLTPRPSQLKDLPVQNQIYQYLRFLSKEPYNNLSQ